MDSITSKRLKFCLEFHPMIGREFLSATISNQGTFLRRFYDVITFLNCLITGILLLLYPRRVVVDFVIVDFVLQIFDLVFWNCTGVTTKVDSLIVVGPVSIAFVSSVVVLICWLSFLTSFEVS